MQISGDCHSKCRTDNGMSKGTFVCSLAQYSYLQCSLMGNYYLKDAVIIQLLVAIYCILGQIPVVQTKILTPILKKAITEPRAFLRRETFL